MIKLAKSHLGKIIDFHVSGAEAMVSLKKAPFALITSIMVFQFVQDIESTMDDLDKALRPGGLIAFAVFNPDHVRNNKGKGGAFLQISGRSSSIETFMLISAGRIPVYIRTERVYNSLLRERGYTRVLCKRPRFTRAFLDRYPQSIDTRFSEYIIIVIKK